MLFWLINKCAMIDANATLVKTTRLRTSGRVIVTIFYGNTFATARMRMDKTRWGLGFKGRAPIR